MPFEICVDGPENPARLIQAQVLDSGSVEDREYRIVTADGKVRWLSDKCFINRQAEPGQPLIIVGIAEDITDKKQMETELLRLATTDALTQSSNRRHFFKNRIVTT